MGIQLDERYQVEIGRDMSKGKNIYTSQKKKMGKM